MNEGMNFRKDVLDVLDKYPAGISMYTLAEQLGLLNRSYVGTNFVEVMTETLEELQKEFCVTKLEMVGNKTKYNPDGVFCVLYFPYSTKLRVVG